MKIFKIFILILFFCLSYSTINAEIYFWTDENGVKHFSNTPPDIDDEKINTTEEVPYDEIADQKRAEVEKQIDKERARRIRAQEEQAKRKTMLLKRQQESEQKQLEVKQEEEAAKKAEAVAKRKEKSAAKKARQREAAANLNK